MIEGEVREAMDRAIHELRAGDRRAPRVPRLIGGDVLERDGLDRPDLMDIAGRRRPAVAEDYEERDARVMHRDAAEDDVRDVRAVDGLDRHRRLVDVLDDDI